jgi:hypothetical protein
VRSKHKIPPLPSTHTPLPLPHTQKNTAATTTNKTTDYYKHNTHDPKQKNKKKQKH